MADAPVLDTTGASVIPAQPPPAPSASPADAPPQPSINSGDPNALGGNASAPSLIQQGIADEKVNGPNWGARALHGILSGLGGTDTVVYTPGPDGKLVASGQPKTSGQQWKTMIAGALSGVGASAEAGSGPGATARGIALGASAGAKQAIGVDDRARGVAQQDFENQQKQRAQQAQSSLIAQQTAQISSQMAHANLDADEHATDRLNELHDLIKATPGARVLGTVEADPSKGDLSVTDAQTRFIREHPEEMKGFAPGNIHLMPTVTNGKHTGYEVSYFPTDALDQPTTEDTNLYSYVPPKNIGDAPTTQVDTIPAGQTTRRRAINLHANSGNEASKAALTAYNEAQQRNNEAAIAAGNNRTSRANNASTDATEVRVAQIRDGSRATTGLDASGNAVPFDQLPTTAQATLRAYASYNAPANTFPERVSPGSHQMDRATATGYATQINPNFSGQEYGSRAAVRKSITSGQISQNLTSLNTAVSHLDALDKSIDALHNRRLPVYNFVANAIDNANGDPRTNNVGLRATAVENEIAKAFKGSGATDQEIKEWRDKFPINGSPQTQHQAVRGAIELLGGRMDAINDTVERGLGQPRDFHVLSPSSENILHRLGADDIVSKSRGNAAISPDSQVPPLGALKPGVNTTFGNGQTWTVQNGRAVQVKTNG